MSRDIAGEKGMVYLLGAGPGAAGLITERGRNLLENADCVVYDRLVNKSLLNHAGEARLIYAGKKPGEHSKEQEEINEILVNKAQQNKLVVRLKGGDPCVFGRGGEEAQHLAAAGIDFEIVPGVSSFSAAPIYAGIPLTHRDYSSSVAVVTGHRSKNSEKKIDIPRVDTLVLLMGVGNIDKLMKKIEKNGYSPETPAAIVARATTPAQRVETGTVSSLAAIVERKNISPPAVIVVGEVVELREELSFFEEKPLFGQKVVVTRPAIKSGDFKQQLAEAGAEVIEFPTVKLKAVSPGKIDSYVNNLSDYHSLIFTSSRGVNLFMDRVFELKDARFLAGVNICAIGPVTAEALAKYGVKADFIPEKYRAERILDRFPCRLAGERILIPRSDIARDVLPENLRDRGAKVDVVSIYSQKLPDLEIPGAVEEGNFDIITFTSSSTVNNFFEILGFKKATALLKNSQSCCIGPVTARTLRDKNISPEIVAEEYTTRGLYEAILSREDC